MEEYERGRKDAHEGISLTKMELFHCNKNYQEGYIRVLCENAAGHPEDLYQQELLAILEKYDFDLAKNIIAEYGVTYE